MSRSRVLNLANFQTFQAINVLSDPGHIAGPVTIPNGVRVMPVFTLTSGKTARMVLTMTVGAAFTPTATIATTIFTTLTTGTGWTTLAGFLAPTGALARVELQDIRSPSNPIVPSTGTAVPGTSTGIALPDEVAAVITLRTALVGPANRGRAYVPNWASTALATGNVIAAAAVAALGTWATGNINTAIVNAGGVWVVAQPARAAYTGSTGRQHPARNATSQPVTQAIVRDNHWDTQRRRGLK